MTHSYNVWNQLISTKVGDVEVKYTYNAEGQRIEKTTLQKGVKKTTRYVRYGTDIALELDENGKVLSRNITGTSAISREMDGVKYFLLYNGEGDVTALTDRSGAVAERYYYDAFGNVLESVTGSGQAIAKGSSKSNLKYRGYEYDEETKLYYLNARYYDPTTARFLQEDTYRGELNDPLSLNLYTYCNNNPIVYEDPSGHWPQFINNVVKAVKTSASQIVTKAKTATKEMSQKVTQKVKETVKNVTEAAKAVKTVAKESVKTAVKAVQESAKKVAVAIKTIKEIEKKGETIIKQAVKPIVDNVVKVAEKTVVGRVAVGVVKACVDITADMVKTSLALTDKVNPISLNKIEQAALFVSDPAGYSKAVVTKNLSIAGNISKVLSDPQKATNEMMKNAGNFIEKNIVNGDAETRAYAATRAIVEIGTFFIGVGEVKAALTAEKAAVGLAEAAGAADALSAVEMASAAEAVSTAEAASVAESIEATSSFIEGGSTALNPKDIHFMQSSIKNQTGSHTVLENIDALKSGTLKPEDLPTIKVWQDEAGKIWTLDHRRLASFKGAELDSVPVQWATPQEVADQMWKMTTRNGGTSIKLKLGNGQSTIIN